MKNFLKPTKDKIIMTLVMPSYLIFFFNFETSNFISYWLPIPILLFLAGLIFLSIASQNNSQINFVLQKLEHESLTHPDTKLANLWLLVEFFIPFLFNYLLACLFFHWYYNRNK